MYHGVMVALELLVLSVIVRIGVEQLQRRALQILQGSFLYALILHQGKEWAHGYSEKPDNNSYVPAFVQSD